MNYDTLKDEVKRSSNYTLLAGDAPIDDSTLASGWYRIDSSTGNDIVTEIVLMYQCGTIYPLWMKGKLKNKDFLDGKIALMKEQNLIKLKQTIWGNRLNPKRK